VRELLRRVWVAARRVEEPGKRALRDPLVRLREAALDERSELARRDRPELEPLRTPPEGRVAVAEDLVEDMAPASEVDVRDLRLRLEDGAHQVREVPVERDDLLELVEHDRDAALPLRRDPRGQLEQLLDRVVDVGLPPRRLEHEAERPFVVDLDRRPHAQRAEEARGAIDGDAGRGVELRRDRLCERRREPLLRRRLHQVAVAHEHVGLDRFLRRAENERRLAVAAWRVQDDVLPVHHVARQLAHLVLAIREGGVERERSEDERIRRLIHSYIM
jgi:hypothetical protein